MNSALLGENYADRKDKAVAECEQMLRAINSVSGVAPALHRDDLTGFVRIMDHDGKNVYPKVGHIHPVTMEKLLDFASRITAALR